MSPETNRAPAASGLLRVIGRVVHVKEGEARGLGLSFAYFFTLLCAYSMLKPIRDEMGITGGVKNLPWMFTATFVGMLIAVPAFSAVAARFPRRLFVPGLYRFCAIVLLAFFALWQWKIGPVVLARAFFVWVGVFNLFITSVFWALMADVFRASQGARLFGFIAAGGGIGAMIGPLLAAAIAPRLGPSALLPLSAVLFEVVAACARALTRWSNPQDSQSAAEEAPRPAAESGIGGGAFSGITLLVRSPYLLGIGAQTILYSTTSTLLYPMYLSLVERSIADSGQRTALFGIIESSTSLLAVALQLAVSGRVLERFGIALSLALLPAVTLVGFLAVGAAPVLTVIVAFYAVRRSAHYAFERPAREVLFTSVSREAKYKTKSLIDTLLYRAGDTAGAWTNTALNAAGIVGGGVALAAVPLAASGIAIALFLARHHALAAAPLAGGSAGGKAPYAPNGRYP
jgi:AAA family ATP:ADP antiporter